MMDGSELKQQDLPPGLLAWEMGAKGGSGGGGAAGLLAVGCV